MGKLWDIVKEIILREEEELRRIISEGERRVKQLISLDAGQTVDISDQTFSDPYELELKGAGYIPLILLKTTDKNYKITIITEKGDQFRNKDFDGFYDISLGNPYVDADDRLAKEGYYYLAIKGIKFTRYCYFLLKPIQSTYVKNLFIRYYLIESLEV